MNKKQEKQVFILPHPARKQCSRLAWLAANGTLRYLRVNLPFAVQRHWPFRGHAANENWVVGVCLPTLVTNGPPACIYRAQLRWVRGWPRLVALPKIQLSVWQQVEAVLLDGDWLYVGGSVAYGLLWKTESTEPRPATFEHFVRYNLTELNPTPESVPLPLAFGPGKAIDDLLRLGDELLVVDNVVYPKYLFFYQLHPTPQLPQWQRTHRLPFSRVYEHIRGGEWNTDFIVLLSSSIGMGGGGYYVSVLRRPDLKPVLVLSTFWASRTTEQRTHASREQVRAVALQGNVLLVACGERGVARLKLAKAPIWPRRRVYATTYLWSRDAAGRSVVGEPKRSSHRELAPPLDLATAGSADGVEWLDLCETAVSVEAVRFVGPGLVLLTDGRQSWLKQLP